MSTIKSNQKGEIVTILTVGTLVVLSAITLVSSILLPKNKQTTASRAEDPTTCSNPNKPIDFCIREECDTAISKWVMIEKFCNNEKKIIEKAGAATNRSCNQAGKQCCGGGTTSCTLPAASTSTQTSGGNTATGNATTTTGSVKSNGCFSLKAEFEQKLENGKVAFYTWVTFESATAGDVELLANGQHAAGWNGFGGGRFTYDPNWTHPGWPGNWGPIAIVDLGKSVTAGYEGFVRNCNPQSTTINCTLTANSNGIGSVSGESGCVCKNCAVAAPATAAAPAAPAAPADSGAAAAPAAASTAPCTANGRTYKKDEYVCAKDTLFKCISGTSFDEKNTIKCVDKCVINETGNDECDNKGKIEDKDAALIVPAAPAASAVEKATPICVRLPVDCNNLDSNGNKVTYYTDDRYAGIHFTSDKCDNTTRFDESTCPPRNFFIYDATIPFDVQVTLESSDYIEFEKDVVDAIIDNNNLIEEISNVIPSNCGAVSLKLYAIQATTTICEQKPLLTLFADCNYDPIVNTIYFDKPKSVSAPVKISSSKKNVLFFDDEKITAYLKPSCADSSTNISPIPLEILTTQSQYDQYMFGGDDDEKLWAHGKNTINISYDLR